MESIDTILMPMRPLMLCGVPKLQRITKHIAFLILIVYIIDGGGPPRSRYVPPHARSAGGNRGPELPPENFAGGGGGFEGGRPPYQGGGGGYRGGRGGGRGGYRG